MIDHFNMIKWIDLSTHKINWVDFPYFKLVMKLFHYGLFQKLTNSRSVSWINLEFLSSIKFMKFKNKMLGFEHHKTKLNRVDCTETL